MIRLMCSKDRQGLQELESKLFKAGVRFEIRGNPLTTALGIARFEIHVDDADLAVASNIWRGCAATDGRADAPGDFTGTRGFNGFVTPTPSGLVIEPNLIPSPAVELLQDDGLDRRADAGRPEPKGDITQATAFLEEDVEALLEREMELANHCSSLEEKVKNLDAALEHSRAELAREVANRSVAEQKLAEAGEAHAALKKDMLSLELRLKATEQALAAANGQLESQAQQQEKLLKARTEEHLQAQACVGTVNDLRSQIRARLAAREKKDMSPPERPKRHATAERMRASIAQVGA